MKKQMGNKKAIIWLNGLISYFKDLEQVNNIITKADVFIVDLPTMGFASNFGKNKIILDNTQESYYMIDRVISDYQLAQKYDELILYGKDLGAIIAANYCNQTENQISKLIMYEPLFDLNCLIGNI